MKKIALILAALVLSLSVVSSVLAQTLEGEDVKIEVRNIELKTSTKTAEAPQASAEFINEGYLLQTLAVDKTVSRPFTSSPQSYLLRAKPGIGLALPLTINNYQSVVVLDLTFVPFNSQSSIDCNVVKVSACDALDWLSINKDSQKLFMEAGEAKEVQLELTIPEDASEGDYYLSIRLGEYNKPYHYTSTELYITVTKDGIIQQNVSVDGLKIADSLLFIPHIPTVVFGDQAHEFLIQVNNGSPVYGVADFDIRIRSLLGFEQVIAVPVRVVLGNTTTELVVDVEKLPFGLLTLSLHDNVKIPALVLPNPIVSLVVLGMVVVSIWSFMLVKRAR